MTLPTTLLAAALSLAAPFSPPGGEGISAPGPAAQVSALSELSSPEAPAAATLRQGAELMAQLSPVTASATLVAATAREDAVVLQARNRRGIPLMASGAALLVAGLLIGDDVGTLVALGGAVIGAYGVFLYF
jgi:hypothetical protein